MALGMMMLSVCRHHRFDNGSDVKPDRIQLLVPLSVLIPGSLLPPPLPLFRQRKATKDYLFYIFLFVCHNIIIKLKIKKRECCLRQHPPLCIECSVLVIRIH